MAIYMMREQGWTPGSDTVSYFPLKTDFNDHYGGHNLNNSGATITTLNGVACAYYSGTATSTNNNASVPATRTFNFWIYGLKNKSGDAVWSGSGTQSRLSIGVRGSDGSPFISDYNAYGQTYSADLSNQWVNLCGIVVGHKMYLYVNGVLRVERTRSYQTASSSYFRLGGTDGSERFNGYLSEVIWEKREWTAQEVLDYYNDTKSNYGIGVLPSTYQEVEYIESNGTQHIDTGLTVSGNVKADYEYMPKENVSSQASGGLLFSMDTDWKNNGFGSGNVYLYFGNQTSSGAGVSITTLAINTKFHDIVSKDGCSRNGGTVWTPSSTSTSPTGTLKLFCSQRNGSIINHWWTRMFTFKRYDNDVLTQDLVPCYRKSDSVAGLYDLVNDQFFTNAGTGTFTVGPDV